MTPELLEVSKRRHNFGTKRFKEKSLFIFHASIALKSLILLFVRLFARGARIGKTHTQTHRETDRTSTLTLAHARRELIMCASYSVSLPLPCLLHACVSMNACMLVYFNS